MQFRWLKFVLDTVISFEHIDILIDSTTDPTCQVCGEAGPHTMEHWLLDSPALSLTRMEIFGRHDLNLDVLATSPKQGRVKLLSASVKRLVT